MSGANGNGNGNGNGNAVAKPGRNTRAAAAVKAFHEEERFGKAYDLRLVKNSWPFVRPHQKLLWLSLAVVIFTAASALVRPQIMKRTLDQGVVAGHPDVLMKGGLLLAGVMIVEQLLGFLQMYAMQVAGARAMSDLRRHVFRFLHRQRLGFFDRQLVWAVGRRGHALTSGRRRSRRARAARRRTPRAPRRARCESRADR